MTHSTQRKPTSGPMRVVRAATDFFRGMAFEQDRLPHEADMQRICFRMEERVEVQNRIGTMPASIGKTFVGQNIEFVVGVGFRTQESNETVPYNTKHGLRVLERSATTEDISRLLEAIKREGRSNTQIRTFVAEHWQAMGFPTCPFPSNA